MNAKELTDQQKEALLDLLVLGMYSDHHLASAEDERVARLVETFGFSSEYARQQFVDASFGRINRRPQSAGNLGAAVSKLSERFSDSELKRHVVELLEGLLASDSRVTAEESQFLATVRKTFKA